jgi:hypothetical protein
MNLRLFDRTTRDPDRGALSGPIAGASFIGGVAGSMALVSGIAGTRLAQESG